MIAFVNAKINIGLRIVGKRTDGYHNLETLFYPVGLYAGTAENPEAFGDVLEITPRRERGFSVKLTGRPVDCPLEKNLVHKAAKLYFDTLASSDFGADITLDKHLPDGAGCGGGSADASFVLKTLSALDAQADNERLAELALRLGADCPFFIYNRPMYAEGVGEILESIPWLDLRGRWLLLVKPAVYVSTREAFSGVNPKPSDFDLRQLPMLPVEEWRDVAVNDFEASIFPKHPELKEIKGQLYSSGAQYASMTGSGSALYGIFGEEKTARAAKSEFENNPTIEGAYLLKM